MVSMTKKALDGPNSSLAHIRTDASQLLKTSSEAFDSMSKALSLSTSSIVDGIAKLKLVEAVPRPKGGEEEEDEANKTKPSPEKFDPEKIDPQKIINLEKTPPAEGDKEKTPPVDPKGKSIAGQGPEKKDTPLKTADPNQTGPSSPKADESSSFSGEEEDEAEKARKAQLAETDRLGRGAALLLDQQEKADEAKRMEESRVREQEEAARLAAQRPLVTQIQRVPPTGKDIVPFMTDLLPGEDEVLGCRCQRMLPFSQ